MTKNRYGLKTAFSKWLSKEGIGLDQASNDSGISKSTLGKLSEGTNKEPRRSVRLLLWLWRNDNPFAK